MKRQHRRVAGWAAFAFLVGALAAVAAGCGGSGGSSGGKASTEITGLGSTIDEIKSKAKDEGQVDLVIWAGYADKSWAKEFTHADGLQGRDEGRSHVGRHDRLGLDGSVRRRFGLRQRERPVDEAG